MAPRRTLVREVNPHLICVLCRGYFIEATTITECLHSFCRSCLVKYLETSKFCPICDVQLHKNNPLLSVRCDPTLQQLVYKLIPGLYANEMARRRKYYSELGGPSSDPEASEYPVGDAYFAPEDSISLSLEFTTSATSSKDEESGGSDVEESQVDKQGVLHRRYLQCPAAVTMSHLQKFLRMKYGFSHEVKVDIIYEGEVLPEAFSLMDVAYTFNWQRTAPMRFKFRLLQKSEVSPKGIGIEKTKKLVEPHTDDVVQKPVAEAKVFAFSNVPKTFNPPVQKTYQSQTATLSKATEDVKIATVSQEMKETKVQKEASKEKEVKPLKEKEVKPPKEVPASKEGKEIQSLKELKPKNINLNEKPVEKSSFMNPLKRTYSTKSEGTSVETKKLKIILEPLPNMLKQEKMKSITSKPEIIKLETIASKPPPVPIKIIPEKQPEIKPVVRQPVEKITVKEVLKKEPEKVKTKEPVEEVEEEEEEPNYLDDIIQEDDYDDDEEDRLHISPTEEDLIIEEKVDPAEEQIEAMEVEQSIPSPEPERIKSYSRSEEKRKEKKKNKKAKHHHHRHHDRKRDSPPIATILHSPDNDLKLKFKLTNTNPKPKYTIMDNSDSRKDVSHSHSSPKHHEKYSEKEHRPKVKEQAPEVPKKTAPPVVNNNYMNSNVSSNNNNNLVVKNNQVQAAKIEEIGSKERSFQLKICKQKVTPIPPSPKPPAPKVPSPVQKPCPAKNHVATPSPKPSSSPKQTPIVKQNGAVPVKHEIKLPPSSITVSKITAAEKAQMEQQKLLMNHRSNSMGLDSKRPSLEIMLVNAPKKAGESGETKPVEVKKVMRPTPPSIPLSRLKNFGPNKGSPPPLVLANKQMSANDENGALDLSGKSSRKSPEMDSSMRNLVMLSNTAVQERMMSSLEPLKIPIPPMVGMSMKPNFQQAQQRTMKPGPNQTVRQIPNPSALMYRQHALNNQRSVPPSLPINSQRKMETMAKNMNLEKVAAGLSVKAAVEAGYQHK